MTDVYKRQTHGQHNRARKPGSIGACSYPAKVFKGMRMGGQMSGDRVTTHNLQVLNCLLYTSFASNYHYRV